MHRKYFTLDISANDYQLFYKGAYNVIVTRTEDGQRLQFPAGTLRSFVSHTGIHGRFQITFTPDHKMLDLKKVG